MRRPAGPATLSALFLLLMCGGIVLFLAWLAPELVMPAMALIVGIGVLWGVRAGVPMLRELLPRLRWWHLLWAALFLSFFTFRVRDTEALAENPLDPWGMYRVGLVGIVAVALLLRLATKATNTLAALSSGAVGWLVAYGLVNLVSAVWSAYPALTVYKSLEYLTDLVLLAAIVATVRSSREYKTIFDWTWALYGILVLVVWSEVLAWPAEALEYHRSLLGIQISGVVPSVPANTVGKVGAVLGIVSLTRLLRSTAHRTFYAVAFLLSLTTLVFAQSRGPYAGFLAAVALILIATRRWGILIPVVLAALVVLLNPGPRDMAWEFARRGQDAELLQSLSGRTFWWSYAWERFHEHPVVGYGGYAGPRFAVLAGIGQSFTSSLHNTWLEVLLGVGVVGLLPLLAAVLAVCTTLWRFRSYALREDESGHLWLEAAGVLTVLLPITMFNTELIWHPPLFFMAVVGYTQQLRGRPLALGREDPVRPFARALSATARP
jgi:O-antigen ligase